MYTRMCFVHYDGRWQGPNLFDEEQRHLYSIYTLTCQGKTYVGQTCCTKNRFKKHRSKSSTECRYIRAVIDKYGWSSVIVSIIETELTKKEADDAEDYYIYTFDSLAPNGYNLTTGGSSTVMSEETRKCWEEAMEQLRNDPEYREKHLEGIRKNNEDPEFIEKRKDGTTKYWEDEENRNKESDRRKILYKTKGGACLNTEEAKQKKSDKMKILWQDAKYVEKVKEKQTEAMLKLRKFTDEEFLEANTRLNGKIPLLAAEFDVSITTIKEHRKRLGLSRPWKSPETSVKL
ncbi:GIY-YIG catalytic domain-containing endonuclease [Paramecium bursaria Chlorella virus NW665.2]|nr:GIY-YIG catalytic domain-containing endonuclease [Paramecium bursaria Chlorella virus NW665.2]